MAIRGPFLFCILALFGLLACTGTTDAAIKPSHYSIFNRSSFPSGFIFGSGSSAYQEQHSKMEGDQVYGILLLEIIQVIYTYYAFFQSGDDGGVMAEKIADRSTGDVADDFYHRYKEDIKLMKKVGLDSFRFSLSWSRILPKGKVSGGVNPLGVKFYNNLINELLANGLKPFVTLFHFDLPQALEDEYGGFLSPKILKDYVDYADFCFKTFGDRVKLWVTMNEPNGFIMNAYSTGIFPPGRCSNYLGNCTSGDSATEPYVAAHHLLLCHGEVNKLYKQKYQPYQKGKIGITIVTHWFAHPITYGEYPKSMRTLAGRRLPKFTEDQSKLLKGSFDFLGLNYYSTQYADQAPPSNGFNLSYTADRQVNATRMADNGSVPLKVGVNDKLRIIYLDGHLKYLLKAMKNGVNVKAYYVWSFLDDFEWDSGYTARFGLTYVDFKNNLTRHLKDSAFWYKRFLLN
ncbi:hypothetical protein Dsin_011044 [Dipteronia sinensis]|uniref:Uncharacterized protein n=1 Tax=Dipteronia sinensis TaxID=43782 RepID=A0AAE0EDF1_9ROSI|nr:hypothetical protein Dsin_011044 [Dipteronia sinensis]